MTVSRLTSPAALRPGMHVMRLTHALGLVPVEVDHVEPIKRDGRVAAYRIHLTGWDDDPTLAPTDATQHLAPFIVTSRSKVPVEVNIVYCPYCGMPGPEDEVDDHRATAHQSEPQQGSNLRVRLR